MKKILIALLALGISVGALAQDKSPFIFSGAAYAYSATYQTTTKDQYMSFSAYRFRPYLSYKTDEVEATIKLEIDQFFGDKGSASATEKYAKVGADTKGAMEVKAAYMAAKIPAVEGLSIKFGVDEYKTPGGLIIGTEAGYGMLTYKFDTHSISGMYLKIVEGKDIVNQEDVTMYGLDINLGIGDIKVRPALYLIEGGKLATLKPWTDNMAIVGALGVSMKMDELELEIAGTYATGEDKVTSTKYSGYAVDISPSYAVDKDIKVGAFFTMLSGDDAGTADKENFSAFQLKADGYGRMFLLQNMQTFSNVASDAFADIRGLNQGYMLAGVFVNAKVNVLEVKLNAAYGQLMQEAGTVNDKKDLGFEADLSVAYVMNKNAKLIADFAYLGTGKAFTTEGFGSIVEEQAAIYAGLGLALKF